MKNRPFNQRFSFALAGLAEGWRREKSFRTQVLIGLLAILLIAILRPGLWWAALVAMSIALVLAIELLNSAIERLLDYLHPNAAPEIKLAKDVAAAAVLIMSVGAICVGGLMILAWLSR